MSPVRRTKRHLYVTITLYDALVKGYDCRRYAICKREDELRSSEDEKVSDARTPSVIFWMTLSTDHNYA